MDSAESVILSLALVIEARVSAAEYEQIKQHPVIGDRLCGGMRSLRQVLSGGR